MSSGAISSYLGGSQTHLMSASTKHRATQLKPMMRRRPSAAAAARALSTTSLYETLGISEKGTFIEIKRAYKQLARKFHPDVSRDPERVDEFTRRFIQIQEAYHTLSDPNTRALYDTDSNKLYQGMSMEDWRYQVDELVKQSTSKRNTWGSRMRRHNNYEQPQSSNLLYPSTILDTTFN